MCVETIEVLIGLNNWFNIKVNKLVPCPHCVENQTPEPDQWNFRLSDLASLAAKGTWVAECTANPQDKKAIQLTRLVPDMALSDLDMVKIPYEELVLSEEVGKGAFGVIHRATWYTLDVAVKSLVSMQQEDQRQKAFEEFRREVWVMSGMKHPNLVNLLGFCVDPFAIVMEFIPYGNLHHYLRDKTKPLDWSLRLKIALDIAKGMYYLHDATPPFIHRDLKSPNILLVDLDPNAEVTAKIGDFGLSSRMYVPSLKENSKDRDVVNPTWLAPEIIREEEFTEKSDVYSYGIILWELLTGAHPFGEFQFQFMFELEDLVKRGGRPTMPADAPTDFATLIRRCWSGDPNERPAFLEIITSLIAIAAEMAPALYIPEDILQTNKQGTAGTWARIDTGDGTDGPALTGQFLKQIKTNPVTKVYSLLQCTGNQMWAGTRDGSILIYNTENGQLMARNENIHKQQINTMILANRRVWTHSWGEDIKIWKLLDQEQVRQALVAAEKTSEETYLQIRSSGVTKKLKRRFVVLKNKRMIIYKFDTDKAPQSIIELPGALIAEEKSPKRCGFELRALNNKPLQFVCKDKAEQAEWFNLVKTEIDRQEKQYDLELVSKIEVSDVHCITVLDGKVWAGTTEVR
jgi:serine/threonine protein kinase